VLNDDGIYVLIAHDNRQIAAYLAAGSLIRRHATDGAVGFKVGRAHGGSLFVGQSSWAM
jgi:hypothetical protein